MSFLEMEDDDDNLAVPPGFRFSPTDEELVNLYLKKRAFGQTIADVDEIIPELDVFQKEPSLLPVGGRIFRDARFFFNKTKRQAFGDMDERVVGSGYWRTKGRSKEIVVYGTNKLIGIKHSLVFWEGGGKFQTKTNWVMHEFRLIRRATPSNPILVSDWAVYRLCQKKSRSPEGSDGEPSSSNNVEAP